MKELKLAYLYPEIMNLYADRGNVITLVKRCDWYGIDLTVDKVSLGDRIDTKKYDLVFIGGGQDKEQRLVSQDFSVKKGYLLEMAEDNVVMLAVCGGYQLFGKFYRPADAPELSGLGIFDMETVAGTKRLIGNVVVETNCFNAGAGSLDQMKERSGFGLNCNLVGFENHSGKTYLGSGVKPLGMVKIGFGNNGEDGTEGAVYKNVYGTYLHGSLLPKNPWFTDHLIKLALERRYGEADLRRLDDTLENRAHQAAVARARTTIRRARFIPEWLRR